jgi:hypothetical protein
MSARSSSASRNNTAVNGATLYSRMRGNGVSSDKAAKLGIYLQQMFDYMQKHPGVEAALKNLKDGREVYEGTKAAVVAAPYVGSLNTLVQDSGRSGGASVLGVFVDRFGTMAKAQGIQLNECALSVARVAADIGGAGVGAVTSVSGWGLLLLGISAVSTFNDGRSLGKACLPGSD